MRKGVKMSDVVDALLVIIVVVLMFLAIGCEALYPTIPLDENGQKTFKELNVEITFFVYDNEIEVINHNAHIAYVIVLHRVYWSSEKYTEIFERHIEGTKNNNTNNWVRETNVTLNSGDEYRLYIKVDNNVYESNTFELGDGG